MPYPLCLLMLCLLPLWWSLQPPNLIHTQSRGACSSVPLPYLLSAMLSLLPFAVQNQAQNQRRAGRSGIYPTPRQRTLTSIAAHWSRGQAMERNSDRIRTSRAERRKPSPVQGLGEECRLHPRLPEPAVHR